DRDSVGGFRIARFRHRAEVWPPSRRGATTFNRCAPPPVDSGPLAEDTSQRRFCGVPAAQAVHPVARRRGCRADEDAGIRGPVRVEAYGGPGEELAQVLETTAEVDGCRAEDPLVAPGNRAIEGEIDLEHARSVAVTPKLADVPAPQDVRAQPRLPRDCHDAVR